MDKWQKDIGKGFNRPLHKENHQKKTYSESKNMGKRKIQYFTDAKKELIDESLFDEKEINNIKVPASSQMRKFYDEVKSLQMRLDNATKQDRDREHEFLKLRPLLKMMKSKVSYARNRLGDKMPWDFVNFIHNNVNSIIDSKDFEAFALYFEALVGYQGGKK